MSRKLDPLEFVTALAVVILMLKGWFTTSEVVALNCFWAVVMLIILWGFSCGITRGHIR